MITIVLPEWFVWFLVALFGLNSVLLMMQAYLSWLKHKLEKMK